MYCKTVNCFLILKVICVLSRIFKIKGYAIKDKYKLLVYWEKTDGKLNQGDLRNRFREIKKFSGGLILGSSYHPYSFKEKWREWLV